MNNEKNFLSKFNWDEPSFNQHKKARVEHLIVK